MGDGVGRFITRSCWKSNSQVGGSKSTTPLRCRVYKPYPVVCQVLELSDALYAVCLAHGPLLSACVAVVVRSHRIRIRRVDEVAILVVIARREGQCRRHRAVEGDTAVSARTTFGEFFDFHQSTELILPGGTFEYGQTALLRNCRSSFGSEVTVSLPPSWQSTVPEEHAEPVSSHQQPLRVRDCPAH